MAKRAWPSPRDVRSVESFSGSIGKTSAAVYTEVVLVRAWPSMAEPSFTKASTSATATRIFVAPCALGSATESWSRWRESSLSIEAQRRLRRSRMDGSVAAAAFAKACVSSRTAGEKSGCRPRWIMARWAMALSSFRFGRRGGFVIGRYDKAPSLSIILFEDGQAIRIIADARHSRDDGGHTKMKIADPHRPARPGRGIAAGATRNDDGGAVWRGPPAPRASPGHNALGGPPPGDRESRHP